MKVNDLLEKLVHHPLDGEVKLYPHEDTIQMVVHNPYTEKEVHIYDFKLEPEENHA